MIRSEAYPILEFDPDPEAKLTPEIIVRGWERLSGDKLVITFFPEVVERMLQEGTITEERVIPGENPIRIFAFREKPDTMLILGTIGCPACAGNLDMLHALGAEKVMFCGGGGVLDPDIDVGKLLLVEGAIRDEGFSYHYLAPSRCVYADPAVNDRIAASLDARGVGYLRGLAWTTDAIFRETEEKVRLRRAEGALIVEMEQAGCLAVARCRGFSYGALVYGGDDVASAEWSKRAWRSRNGLRYDLVMLCRDLVHEI